jgi:acyl transferase domain-containing protein/thioesterase domain-containing protein/SAM-dependent methyltransferase
MNKSAAPKKTKQTATGMEIAVIGMACRFPGAGNYRQFWKNLEKGVESITFYSESQLAEAGVSLEMSKHPDFVKSGGGVLEKKEYFDAAFFDYSHREAEVMDPQMRIFHEVSWEALEDAGYDPFSYKGAIGLYGGSSTSYFWESMVRLSGKIAMLGDFATDQLMNRDFLTARVAYKLNLKGANSTMNTACSTSLLAIHQAGRALLTAECKMALAGGVSVAHMPNRGYIYKEGMIMSPDGHTRAFDAEAKGTNAGNGAGMVLLKLMKNAIADGDHIHAVIKGTGANNDGSRKVGFTAPSVEGQAEAIRRAMRMAKIEPASVTYVETHGTATPLGDPVEIEALKRAFKADTIKEKQFIALGAVKTNIGHLDAAAGIAGVIKTVMALKHRKIPPSLFFKTPNPTINFQDSPFYVNHRLTDWKRNGNPLRAGVSSFGIGGTNVHVVLEEYVNPVKPVEIGNGSAQMILLSARTPTALERICANQAEYLRQHPGINMGDAAYTLRVGRKHFKYRRKLMARSREEAVELLTAPDSRKVRTAEVRQENPPVIFLFPGLGSQYVAMGRQLYEKEPKFREDMDRCFNIINPLIGTDLRKILYPEPAGGQTTDPSELNRPDVLQPVMFIFEYALAQLINHWGIEPHAMMGYSFGEYAAAAVAGVFSPEDALRLVVERGKLIRRIPNGAMLSVPLPAERVKPYLERDARLSLAIDNGDTVIAAGSGEAAAELEQRLKDDRIMSMRLPNSHAIHTNHMEPILVEYETFLRQITLNEPKIPYVTNVTGNWVTVEEATSPRHWVNHLRQTVRFADGLAVLQKEVGAQFLEVGPGTDITAMIRRHLRPGTGQQALTLVKNPNNDVSDGQYLLAQVGNLWLNGKNIGWGNIYDKGKPQPQRVPLPTYPFEGERYWIDDASLRAFFGAAAAGRTESSTTAHRQRQSDDDFSLAAPLVRLENQAQIEMPIKGIHQYDGFEEGMNELCNALICDYFKAHGIGTARGIEYSTAAELAEPLELQPKFEKFLDFFLKVLEEDGTIRYEGMAIRFIRSTTEAENAGTLKEQLVQRYPQFAGMVESVIYCARHFPEVLSGRTEGVEVLFPGGRYFRDDPKYKNREEYDNTAHYVWVARQMIQELAVPRWKEQGKSPVRILEIGGGTGLLTWRLISGIAEQAKPLGLEYYFTDIGNYFVVQARKEAARRGWDFVKFGTLDISKDPVSQGFEPGSFDAVLAFNVIHATRNIAESTGNMKRLLVPGGYTIMVEGTNPPRWMNMIDGLAEGWWYYEDTNLRHDTPLLTPEAWQQEVERQGFRQVTVLPLEEEQRRRTRCCLVTAQRQPEDRERIPAKPVQNATFYQRPELSSEYEAPETETERILVEQLQDFFGIEKVGVVDDFFELGMDSLIATVLTTRIQQRFGRRISLAEIYEAANVRRLAGTLGTAEGQIVDDDGDNLVLLRKGTRENSHLFLVHAGSGEVGAYRELAEGLDSGYNIWGIRSQRYRHKAPRNITIEETAAGYLEKIKEIQPEGPYRIAGWSAGGHIVYRLAGELERQGETVSFLGIFSSKPPNADWGSKPADFTLETELQWLEATLQDSDIRKAAEGVSGIEQLWDRLSAELVNKNIPVEALARLVPPYVAEAVPAQVKDVGWWIYYMNTVRTYVRAQALYNPTNPIRTDLHVFDVSEPEGVKPEDWSGCTTGTKHNYMVPGTHATMFNKPQVEKLIATLNHQLPGLQHSK